MNIMNMCEDTVSVLDILLSPGDYSKDDINYVCGGDTLCDVILTGPSWKISLKVSIQSETPKVRMYDTE